MNTTENIQISANLSGVTTNIAMHTQLKFVHLPGAKSANAGQSHQNVNIALFVSPQNLVTSTMGLGLLSETIATALALNVCGEGVNLVLSPETYK